MCRDVVPLCCPGFRGQSGTRGSARMYRVCICPVDCGIIAVSPSRKGQLGGISTNVVRRVARESFAVRALGEQICYISYTAVFPPCAKAKNHLLRGILWISLMLRFHNRRNVHTNIHLSCSKHLSGYGLTHAQQTLPPKRQSCWH